MVDCTQSSLLHTRQYNAGLYEEVTERRANSQQAKKSTRADQGNLGAEGYQDSDRRQVPTHASTTQT